MYTCCMKCALYRWINLTWLDLKGQRHLLVCWWDYRSNRLLFNVLPLSTVFSQTTNSLKNYVYLSQCQLLFSTVWDQTALFLFILFFFEQMESQFPLMWLSLQQTWWLGTQGVTMLVCMSVEPTSPGPENLSSLLLSCVCLVGIILLYIYII